MTNSNNFAAGQLPPYPRYTLSRIIANKQDNLLDMEVPADFSNRFLENNIEINLYSLADNSLVYSDFIKNKKDSVPVFYTERLQYTDGTFRHLLYIDFSKIYTEIQLPPGRYSATLNFFADEVGSYDNRILKVTNIPASRTEVELELSDYLQPNAPVMSAEEKQILLEKFAIPAINVEYIRPVLKQIFNQEGSDAIDIPTSPAKINSSSIYQNFTSGSGDKLLLYNFDEDYDNFIGINTITQNVLNLAYPIALEKIESMILSGSTTFTETELSTHIVDAIDEAYDSALQDEADNPQKYRFDLI